MKTMAIANHKGGTGKTTVAVNLGHALFNLGYEVLLIDLDPHHNLTLHLGIDSSKAIGIEHFLDGQVKYEEVLNHYDNQFCFIPATRRLAVYESKLNLKDPGDSKRYYSVKNTLSSIRDSYDYIIIDCPPSLGLLTVNALAYTQEVIIPIQCQYLALEGTAEMIHVINVSREIYNPGLSIKAVVPVMYDSRTKISNFVVNKLKEYFKDLVTETRIRVNTDLAEAPAFGKTIFDYNKNCHGAWDFKRLADEILNKGV